MTVSRRGRGFRVFVGGLLASCWIAACVPVPDPPLPPAAQAWMDPVGTLLIPASAAGEVPYQQGSVGFHRELHAAMKGLTPVISVPVAIGSQAKLAEFQNGTPLLMESDPGILRWTARIQNTGGSLLACPVTPPESGIWAIFTIVSEIAAAWVNQYLTYKPAENYHAALFYDRGTERVEEIKFFTRTSVDVQSLTCEAAAAL